VQDLASSPTATVAKAADKSLTLLLPRTAKRHISKMMAQQFWLFGYDVRHPQGNVLLELGFEKCRPPEGSRFTTSRYVLRQPDGMTVGLWGFGMYISEGDAGGMFVSRNGVDPHVHTFGDLLGAAWNPTDCDLLRPPGSPTELELARTLLVRAIQWICHYEQGITERFGPAYRHDAIAAWKHACCPAHHLNREWTAAATRLEQMPSTIALTR
jgi:hypothetical protein